VASHGVPHSHAVGKVVGAEAIEVKHGPAFESHPQLAAARLDARDVAEARHERPVEFESGLPAGDFEPEDLDRVALLEVLGRRVNAPGILVLAAVEGVAPERLLVAPPAQPPLVCVAVGGGDPAVKEPLVRLRRPVGLRRRQRDGGCRGLGRTDLLLEGPVADGYGEEGEHGGERPAGNSGSRHGRLSCRTRNISRRASEDMREL